MGRGCGWEEKGLAWTSLTLHKGSGSPGPVMPCAGCTLPSLLEDLEGQAVHCPLSGLAVLASRQCPLSLGVLVILASQCHPEVGK